MSTITVIITVISIIVVPIAFYFMVIRNIRTSICLGTIYQICLDYNMKLIADQKYAELETDDAYRWCIDYLPSYTSIVYSGFGKISPMEFLTKKQVSKFEQVLGTKYLQKHIYSKWKK